MMRLLLSFLAAVMASLGQAASKPNIVVILADDLGYGDVKCLNPQGKIATPHLDALAKAGMTFTDAHSGSAVCTPTRYGLITGRYAWRTKLQQGVLGGLSPRLIEPNRETVASLLKAAGYRTACVGKWHLGMDWDIKPGKAVSPLGIEGANQVDNVNYDTPIKNGPTTVGFDRYLGIAASLDMVPYGFIENDRLTARLTERKQFPLTVGKAGGQTRLGPAAADFSAEIVLPTLVSKTCDWIAELAKDGKPFFLYMPLTAPHTPIAPRKEFAGRSGLSPYADFVMETDAAVGAVVDTLRKSGELDNTVLIFTSDNGCSPQANFPELAKLGHNPSHTFRGTKADIYEGGHRVPFFVRGPMVTKPGTTSDQLTCLTDIMRTCCAMGGANVPEEAGEDSFDFSPVLRGESSDGLRRSIVHHSINGSFAIREGFWKLCLCPGSGGWSAPRPGRDDQSKMPRQQLFDLKNDIAETTNREEQNPAIVRQLLGALNTMVANGRSTPGRKGTNAVAVDVWKAGMAALKPIGKTP
jgi:arylsulfatase A-like enzyme